MTGFRVGQTIECVDAGDGASRLLTEGARYVVGRIAAGRVHVKGDDSGHWWLPSRFRAVEPSLIDPGKWDRTLAQVLTRQYDVSEVHDALGAWCLVNSAAVLLGALVDALPSKPARTWADYPLHSAWEDPDGHVWMVVGHKHDALVGTMAQCVSSGGFKYWHITANMADWVCLSMPVEP